MAVAEHGDFQVADDSLKVDSAKLDQETELIFMSSSKSAAVFTKEELDTMRAHLEHAKDITPKHHKR
jgi:hypothetical protein